MMELRGRRIYLVLATITVLVKLGGLFPMLGEHYSRLGKLLPIVIALSVVFLWWGTEWIQRAAGWAFILSGAFALLRFARSLDSLDVYGISVVFILLHGLVDVLAGVAILKLPALNAFFRHQREGKPELKSPIQKRRVGAACIWGLIMSSGAALLLAINWAESSRFDLDFPGELLSVLGGMGAFALLGVVAGLAVGLSGPGTGTTRRYVVTRGFIAAGACVVVGVLGAAIYGGLFGQASSDFSAAPGWPRAGMWAVMWLFLMGPMLAAAGMALGVTIALLIREDGAENTDEQTTPRFLFMAEPECYYELNCEGIDRSRVIRCFERVAARIPQSTKERMVAYWAANPPAPEFQIEPIPAIMTTRGRRRFGALGMNVTVHGLGFRFAGHAMEQMTDVILETLLAHEIAHAVIWMELTSHSLPPEERTLFSAPGAEQEAIFQWTEDAVDRRTLSWHPEYDGQVLLVWANEYMTRNGLI